MSIFTFSPAKKIILKSEQSEAVLERLRGYLDDNREDPVQILAGMWKDEETAITYKELREAILSDERMAELLALWSIDYSYMVTNKFKKVWEGAMTYASTVEPLLQGKDFVLDVTSPYVKDWVDRRGAALVTALSDTQKEAIKVFLSNNIMEGHTVDELAKLIRPCIGLTRPQTQANIRYYDNVKQTLEKDHPRMKKATIERKAHEAAMKYAERQHRYRADTIAYTEMASAYANGADASVRQAIDENLLGPCRKKWITSRSDQRCKDCIALEGVIVEMDETFQFRGQEILTNPAHPRCMCAIQYIEITPPVFE